MVEPLANAIIMIVIGSGTGLVVGLMNVLRAAARRELGIDSFTEYSSRDRELRKYVLAKPLYRGLALTFGLLLLMIPGIILTTPIYMEWTPFLVSAVVSWILAYIAFTLARTGKLGASTQPNSAL